MSQGYRKCSIEGCDKPYEARGWCPMHYARWKKWGDPNFLYLEYLRTHRKECSIEGCLELASIRGWCERHYNHWHRWGHPTNRPQRETSAKWLAHAVATRDRSEGCWEWPFGLHSSGYGQLSFRGQPNRAHVVALILETGDRPKPPANHALHSCDNYLCCNPAHLRWGTTQDNSADAVARERTARGERSPKAKYTESQIRAVLRDQRHPNLIAKELGTGPIYIYNIKSGRVWKHLHREFVELGRPYGEAIE